MKKASISILKAHLSRYVDAVKSGEDVIVTERGRPVARLTALDLGREPEGRVALLVREGRLRPPDRPGAVAEMVVWWTTPVECDSALARLRREGTLSEAAERDRQAWACRPLRQRWIRALVNRLHPFTIHTSRAEGGAG